MNPAPADLLNAHAFEAMRAGQYDSATRLLREALKMDAKNVHARNNLATCLKQLGREPEAIRHYESLIADEPTFLYAVNNLAFSYLRQGRYAEGWRLYHNRRAAHLKIVTITNPITGKPFLGEPLPDVRGRDVCLVLEQGIGDELFFLRFLARLWMLEPASVWYAPGVKVYPLLRQLDMLGLRLTDSSFSTVPRANAVALPLADLPLLTGHDGTWFPKPLRMLNFSYPYPAPDAPVGVTWRAGDRELVHRGGTSKQCPPEALGRALRDLKHRVVVMQRNPAPEELDAFREGLGADCDVYERDPSPTRELLALTKQLASLSDYIGVSNTDMYLLQLLGRTARTLVIHPAEWRWFGPQVAESPWFPGFRRYHQTVMGWDEALEGLRVDLGLT